MEQVLRGDAATNVLLARYLKAWETDDVDGLVALLSYSHLAYRSGGVYFRRAPVDS
jgi:hypothetical protein